MVKPNFVSKARTVIFLCLCPVRINWVKLLNSDNQQWQQQKRRKTSTPEAELKYQPNKALESSKIHPSNFMNYKYLFYTVMHIAQRPRYTGRWQNDKSFIFKPGQNHIATYARCWKISQLSCLMAHVEWMGILETIFIPPQIRYWTPRGKELKGKITQEVTFSQHVN